MNNYKVSRFTLVEPLPGGRVGLFDALTRALGVVPAGVWEEAVYGRLAGDAALKELAGQGFLVEPDLDEDKVLDHWRASRAYDLAHLEYLVSPTHTCNMACANCALGKRKRAENMSPDTARAVLDFIISDLEAKRPQTARLEFGRCEPLLNPEIMLYLAEGLARFCRGRGLDFKTGLVTNGLALRPDLIEALEPFGLGRVTVSLGGPAEIHDRDRPANDGRPTYERIMDNLAAVAHLTKVFIQARYDPAGSEHTRFPELLDDLAARGLKDRLAQVYFGPKAPAGFKAGKVWPGRPFPAGCLKDEDHGRFLRLEDQAAARGFTLPAGPPAHCCPAGRRDSMVIDARGRIAGCPSMAGSPELNYGDVRLGLDFRREARFMARELPEECRHCPLAPRCEGECPQRALFMTGDPGEVCSIRETFERLTRAYIRRAAEKARI